MATRALAHVYKLEPTPAQRAALARLVGCRRFVYNWGLGRCRDAYTAAEKQPTDNQLAAALTQLKRHPDRLWLAEVDSQALQQALRDLDRAYANFFAGRAERPRFAGKGRADDTARIPQRVRVDEAADTVTIPKVGAVPLVLSRPLVGVVKSATVRRDRCGDWTVSLRLEAPTLVDAPVPSDRALGNAVGIDLGLTTYATLFDGEAFAAVDNPRHRQSRQRALKRAQRDCSRKQKGRKNREQARLRVAQLHRRIARRRADHLHKVTTALVRRYDLLCVEDLNIRGLGRTNLARSIYDAAPGEFLRQVRYKAAWHGKHVVAVDRFYPSSTTCAACGHVYADLGLGERVWTCAACDTVHDRDPNAARNILAEGTRLFRLRSAGDERVGVPRVMAAPGRRAKHRTKTRTRPGVEPGGTTVPTPLSRRDRPRRETPVDGTADVPPGARRHVKQESHTL